MNTEITENIRFISTGAFMCECTLENKPRCSNVEVCDRAEGSIVCLFERKIDEAIIIRIEDGVEERGDRMHPGEARDETDKALAAIAAKKGT